ncbi:MAG: DNA repair protein RecN [Bacilli bacterium]|nr:DNA repair protein RecN [Bacilli bacterium]MDD4584722.1 DNA repair protein RecN [Bacilli bacterium]
MIKQITIKNFAIIDDLAIDFRNGFNVFTGETGAGKSIIIDALSLLTGERASPSMVRYGTSKAVIEGVFELDDNVISKLDLSSFVESDRLLIITKEIDTDGHSQSKINGRIATLNNIKKIMANIIDIHSQNDNQYLLDKSSHTLLIKEYCKGDTLQETDEYIDSFSKYTSYKKELEELKKINYDKDVLDSLKFQLSEIEKIDLKENEVEELEIEQKRIQNFSKISDKYKELSFYINSDSGSLINLYNAKKVIESLSNDPIFSKHTDSINDLYYRLEDLANEIKNDYESINYDEYRVNEIQERIFQINKLKRKYNSSSTKEIFEYKDSLVKKIEDMENLLSRIEELEFKLKTSKEDTINKGEILSKKQLFLSQKLLKEIKNQLKSLYLPNANFDLRINILKEPSILGIYDYEFIVSLNPGTPLLPLIKVASGGEMSRLMLGLKIIFNSLYGISTSIFDEIDVGVSGKVSRSLGEKMMELSRKTQVICITHSPQIASIGDNHYRVEKVIKNNNTYTIVNFLSKDQRIDEIAKMLSGSNTPTQSAIANAIDLLEN